MTQAQLIAQYFSDSDNDIDMEIQPSIDNETIERKTGENGFHYAHTVIRMMLLRKSRMMEYGAKHIRISPTKENGLITGVTKLNDVGNHVQLVFMFYTIVKMNALQCTKQKMII